MKRILLTLFTLLIEFSGFSQLTPFQNDQGKYGYKDGSGNILIEAKYSQTAESNGYGLGMSYDKDESWIIDKDGSILFSCKEKINSGNMQYYQTQQFIATASHFIIKSYANDTSWVLKHDGTVEFTFLGRPIQTLNNDRYILVEREKERTLEDRSYATYFSLIDFNGKAIIPEKYAYLEAVTKDRLIACIGDWKMYDAKTSFKMIKKMTNVKKNNDARLYQLEGKWGIIDLSGQTIIPFKYSFLYHYTKAASDEEGILGSESCNGSVFDYMYYDEWQFGAGGSRFLPSSLDGKDYCEDFRWGFDILYK